MARKKSSKRKYSPKASKAVEREMHEFKQGKLKSGRSGKKVKSRKQAIAIGLSEARSEGAKVPAKKSSSKKSSKKKARLNRAPRKNRPAARNLLRRNPPVNLRTSHSNRNWDSRRCFLKSWRQRRSRSWWSCRSCCCPSWTNCPKISRQHPYRRPSSYPLR